MKNQMPYTPIHIRVILSNPNSTKIHVCDHTPRFSLIENPAAFVIVYAIKKATSYTSNAINPKVMIYESNSEAKICARPIRVNVIPGTICMPPATPPSLSLR